MGVGLYLLFLAVSFGASVVGAICGIGGGVLIKPVLDAVSGLSVAAVSFLSACTVLSMTSCSMLRAFKKGDTLIDRKVSTPLAIGAAFGGVAGKEIFRVLLSKLPNAERVGAVQSFCLFFVMLGLMLYTVKRDRIRTYHLTNPFSCLLAGGGLGLMLSFLGIGGGPIDMIVLFFLFSMDMKAAAQNSLYIIFFSQAASLLYTCWTGSVPDIEIGMLLLMAAGGIGGGMAGRALNQKMDAAAVNKLFLGLMAVIMAICVYNFYQFL